MRTDPTEELNSYYNGPSKVDGKMGGYRILEDSGYTDIVMGDVIISRRLAEKMTRYRQPIITKARFYAKRDEQYFELVVERRYRNRTSNDSPFVSIASSKRIPPDVFEVAKAKVGKYHNYEIW